MFECGICAYLLDDLEVDANLMASLKALVGLVKKNWFKTALDQNNAGQCMDFSGFVA